MTRIFVAMAARLCAVPPPASSPRSFADPPVGRAGFTALVAAALVSLSAAAAPAAAQTSTCQAIAQHMPGAAFIPVSMAAGPAPTLVNAAYEVEITYVGHASFRITAPDGTTIVTDYSGTAGPGPTPDVVTMNNAHITHWTPSPDPAIPNVLRGWGEEGAPAQHLLTVGEVLVRNVPTDVRSYAGVRPSGNSIFIFEIAGLCIGHLGHLHQTLSDAQYAEIGRLDVVFVPIDGSYTMGQPQMMEVVERLRASLAIPMHWFSQYTLANFVSLTDRDGLVIDVASAPTFRVSLNTLPDRPTLKVLPRLLGF